MLTIRLKPLCDIEIKAEATLRDLINEVKRVCEERSLKIPSVYSFAGITWSKTNLDKPLGELLKTKEGLVDVNVTIKNRMNIDEAAYDLHPDNLSVGDSKELATPTEDSEQKLNPTHAIWLERINNFIDESKSFIEASISRAGLLTISGRGSFEELRAWVDKLRRCYPEFVITENGQQAASDGKNRIHFSIAQRLLALHPLDVKQILQGVLFDYMEIDEIRAFCKALDMDDIAAQKYIKEYQQRLFAQVEKEGFQSNKDTDERLYDLYEGLKEIRAGKAGKVLDDAIEKGDYWLAMLAIKYKAEIDVNRTDINGCTALMSAALQGHTEIVKLLLEQPGININSVSRNNNTALTLAARRRHGEILKLLLDHPSIDINWIRKNLYNSDCVDKRSDIIKMIRFYKKEFFASENAIYQQQQLRVIILDKDYWQKKHGVGGVLVPIGIKQIQNSLAQDTKKTVDCKEVREIACIQRTLNSSRFFKRYVITGDLYQYLESTDMAQKNTLFDAIQEDYEKYKQKKKLDYGKPRPYWMRK